MSDEVLITVLFVAALALWRNYLAWKWAVRAINEAHALNCADIDAGAAVDAKRRYDLIPSHYSLLLDITQWRYRSPFKD